MAVADTGRREELDSRLERFLAASGRAEQGLRAPIHLRRPLLGRAERRGLQPTAAGRTLRDQDQSLTVDAGMAWGDVLLRQLTVEREVPPVGAPEGAPVIADGALAEKGCGPFAREAEAPAKPISVPRGQPVWSPPGHTSATPATFATKVNALLGQDFCRAAADASRRGRVGCSQARSFISLAPGAFGACCRASTRRGGSCSPAFPAARGPAGHSGDPRPTRPTREVRRSPNRRLRRRALPRGAGHRFQITPRCWMVERAPTRHGWPRRPGEGHG